MNRAKSNRVVRLMNKWWAATKKADAIKRQLNAQMITQPNMGNGVPCTVHYSAGDEGQPWVHPSWGSRPEPPAPEKFDIKFNEETAHRAKIITDNLKSLQAKLEGLSNGTLRPNKGVFKDLTNSVESARMQIENNIPYIQQCAAEELEKKVGAAVMEFEAYMTRSCEARGLAAMRSGAPVLALQASTGPDRVDVPQLTDGASEDESEPLEGHGV